MTEAQELKSLLGDQAQRETFFAELGALLPPSHHQRIGRILELTHWLLNLLEMKNLSIAKLRRLCFGASSEKASKVCDQPTKPKKKTKAKGHGRNPHSSYTGAKRVKVPHPDLKAGQECPQCRRGKVRSGRKPTVAIAIKAQPPIGACIHEMEQLRCDTCGQLFTAPTPPEAGKEKYDPSVGVMVGLMRYGSGMPFYRLERMQKSLGVPLPSSVQWEQVDRVTRDLEPVFDHLIYLAAQSALVFSDDTTMRVSALRKEIQKEVKPKRTGIFTTGIVSQQSHHPIVLFFTGRAHAGENLAAVLDHREPGRSPPLHMCDGLDRNVPKGHLTVPCQCNVHARRNFVEIENAFAQECRLVVECLTEVYQVEAKAKEDCLTDQQRLELHQAQSRSAMDRLKSWLDDQIDSRKAEPNSTLGAAIEYMRDRWTELTQFLRVPGAPLDNNVTERILKTAILHRKNSLWYRTQRGADVGDLFMSMVQTCRANQVNPFEYMLAIVRNAHAAKSDPGKWLPWNYQLNLTVQTSGQPDRPH
jgi:transposase